MRYLIISVALLLFVFNFAKSTEALECLPTCSTVDGRFLNISGPGLSTILMRKL